MNPPIILCRADAARLEALIDRAAGRHPELLALADEIARAELHDVLPKHVIGMNTRALFVDTRTGVEQEVTLVYPHQINGEPGVVSILAPVGCALLGLSTGQCIEWPLPGGRKTVLRVLAVAPVAHETAPAVAQDARPSCPA